MYSGKLLMKRKGQWLPALMPAVNHAPSSRVVAAKTQVQVGAHCCGHLQQDLLEGQDATAHLITLCLALDSFACQLLAHYHKL